MIIKLSRDLIIFIALVFAVFIFASQIFAQETLAPVQPIPTDQSNPQPTLNNSVPSPQPQQPMAPQQERQMAPGTSKEGGDEQNERRDFVDPREIKDVLRQIKDIKREANRLIKKAKKLNLTDEIGKLNEIITLVADLEAKIKNASAESISRETLQDFYDAQVWEEMNNIRIRIELPNEIKMIERDLKKLEKLISKKTFVVDGVDMEKVKAKIGAIRTALEQAKSNLAQGNLEDARESLQLVYEEGAHPGEIMGVLNRLYEITRQLKKFKSEEIKNEVMDILKPVFEAVESEDYREANMLLNEIDRDLWRILNAARTKPVINQDLKNKIQNLEEKLQLKMQGQQQKDLEGIKNEKQSYYDQRQRSTSLLGNVFNAFLDLLNL